MEVYYAFYFLMYFIYGHSIYLWLVYVREGGILTFGATNSILSTMQSQFKSTLDTMTTYWASIGWIPTQSNFNAKWIDLLKKQVTGTSKYNEHNHLHSMHLGNAQVRKAGVPSEKSNFYWILATVKASEPMSRTKGKSISFGCDGHEFLGSKSVMLRSCRVKGRGLHEDINCC